MPSSLETMGQLNICQDCRLDRRQKFYLSFYNIDFLQIQTTRDGCAICWKFGFDWSDRWG